MIMEMIQDLGGKKGEEMFNKDSGRTIEQTNRDE